VNSVRIVSVVFLLLAAGRRRSRLRILLVLSPNIRCGSEKASHGSKILGIPSRGMLPVPSCTSVWTEDSGCFTCIVIKRGATFGIAEGEGEAVSGGSWTIRNDAINADCRLVFSYKKIFPEGERPPVVPGPMEHSEIRRRKARTTSAVSRREIRSSRRFQRFGRRSHLQVHDPDGRVSKNNALLD
jgi:hypothetical protein